MKKLSLIMALVLVATVGGVYATWTYSGDSIIHTSSSKAAVVTEVEETTEALGSYSVSTNLVSMEIDQAKDTADEYHQAVLKPIYTEGTSEYQLVVTYTPSAFVSNDVKENGLKTYLWFVNDATWKCDEDGYYDANAEAKSVFNLPYDRTKPIVIYPANSTETTSDSVLKWTKVENGNDVYFTCTIAGENAKTFEDLIDLNKIVLDTASINDRFDKDVVKTVVFHISSKTPSETIDQMGS